jgi:hypothetical protein
MKGIFQWLFTPEKNRYLTIGLILTILGVILIPFVIGIPIAGIGFMIFAIGAIISYGQKIQKGKKIIDEFKKFFSDKKPPL